MRAVSNFCVLAGGRIWSAFFSYNILPVFASTTITEAALVFGILSGVFYAGAGIVSGAFLPFAFVGCERGCLVFDVFALLIGVGSVSVSSSAFAVLALLFRCVPD